MPLPQSLVQVVPPVGLAAVEEFYGKFDYVEMSGGNVHITDSFERDNIVTLKNVAGCGRNIQLHRKVAPLFEACLIEARRRCPTYPIRLLGGFCPRHMQHDPKAPLSIHSWGAAFDVNWDTCKMTPKNVPMICDLPKPFIEAFTEQGFEYGGDWRNLCDAMHFQFATGC